MPSVTPAQNRTVPHEPVQPPANVAAAGATAQAAATDDPPPYPNVAPRRLVGTDDLTVYTILMATGASVGLPTEAEVRRAYAMAAAHKTTPLKMQNMLIDLATAIDAPRRPHYMNGPERRLALAALMGIRIGFAPPQAQQMVDAARDKPTAEIAKFVAEELAVGAGVALNCYGAYLVGGKAVAGATAKGAALKAGGLGIAGTAKAGAAMLGWAGLGVLAGVWAAGTLFKGGEVAVGVAARYEDILEPKWFQDRRILEGILNGEVVTTHPIRAERLRGAA